MSQIQAGEFCNFFKKHTAWGNVWGQVGTLVQMEGDVSFKPTNCGMRVLFLSPFERTDCLELDDIQGPSPGQA